MPLCRGPDLEPSGRCKCRRVRRALAGPQLGMRSFLVGPDKAGVACDVGCENCDELSFDLMRGCGVRWHCLSLRGLTNHTINRATSEGRLRAATKGERPRSTLLSRWDIGA